MAVSSPRQKAISKEELVPAKIGYRPLLEIEKAKALVEKNYHLKVLVINELNSYEDKNFYVEAVENNSVSSCSCKGDAIKQHAGADLVSNCICKGDSIKPHIKGDLVNKGDALKHIACHNRDIKSQATDSFNKKSSSISLVKSSNQFEIICDDNVHANIAGENSSNKINGNTSNKSANVNGNTNGINGINGLIVTDVKCNGNGNEKVIVNGSIINNNGDEMTDGSNRKTLRFILKILNSFDSRTRHVEAEHKAMILLRRNGILCPLPVQTRDNQDYFLHNLTSLSGSSSEHIVRLLEYVPGSLLAQLDLTPEILVEIGWTLANIDNALEKLRHTEAANPQLIWDLKNIAFVRPLLSSIPDKNKITLIKKVICAFEEKVLSNLHLLSQGVIHSDYNDQNVIVDETTRTITGVIDFGDMMTSCYVFELAAAIAYASLASKSIAPLSVGGYVLSGYHRARKLTDFEISLLPVCVAGRLAQSLAIGAYSHRLDASNTYLLDTAKQGWKLLEAMTEAYEGSWLAQSWKNAADNYKLQYL